MGNLLLINNKNRSPVVGGLFYPDEKKDMEECIKSWGLDADKGGEARVIIAPHGAWELTGKIAGEAFIQASGRRKGRRQVNRIIILGPVHNRQYGGLYLTDSDFFETPLGKLPVDREFNKDLASCSTFFEVNDIPHLTEHSIEVLLPLVKFYFPKASIVPILMGGSKQKMISSLARSLSITLEENMAGTLVVITTSLSQNFIPTLAESQAEELLLLLGKRESAPFIEAIKKETIRACGGPLLAALLESGLARDAAYFQGSRSIGVSDKGDTVHYGAIAFT
jgi:AmmeMemoRadiSam system protein B